MTDPMRKIQRHKFELVAGGASFLILFLAFLFSGIITITGKKSILVCDMYGQYYEFLVGIRRIIRTGGSLLYSWDLDMGIGLPGWIAYYVSSPFNLVLLVVPESWILGTITFLILLKLSIAAVTFSVYLKKAYQMDGVEIVLGALCYSLSSYAVTYYYQIMWLDILIWLPLLVLGMKKIAEGKKSSSFTVCLVIAFFSNYYISFMAGVFLFTSFVVYYIYQNGSILCVQFFKRLMRFVMSAVMAFGIGGVLLIPTVSQMAERLGTKNTDVKSSFFNFDFIDLLQSTTWGNYFPFDYQKPLLYCSCLFLLLVPLYFFNPKIMKKERAGFGLLLGFWFVIMLLRPTDLFMHIGKVPTQFPCRYGFVVCFLIATLGAKELHYLFHDTEGKKKWLVCAVFVLFSGIAKVLDCMGVKSLVSNKNILITAGLFLGYTLLLHMTVSNKLKRHDFVTLISFMLIVELLFNSISIYDGMDYELGFKDYSEIQGRQKLLEKQLTSIGEEGEPFRIEKNYRFGYNDGFAIGYPSISSFSSVYNEGVHRFLANMGISNQLWNSSYRGSTTFLNSVLGIKYVFHTSGSNDNMLMSGPTESIEKTQFPLPFGFMADEKILEETFSDEPSHSAMKEQQDFLEALTGDEESRKCFEAFQPDKIICENVKRTYENDKIIMKPDNAALPASVSYYVTGDGRKEYYFYPQFDPRSRTKYVEIMTKYNFGLQSQYIERMNLSIPYNIRLFDQSGATDDTITFHFHTNETAVLDKELFYSFDKERYEEYYNKLLCHSISFSKFEDGYFDGEIDAGKTGGIIFLSIPYNKKWNVYIDGKKAEILSLCQNTFIGVKAGAGKHLISGRYTDSSVNIGKTVSLISFILYLCFLFYEDKKEI